MRRIVLVLIAPAVLLSAACGASTPSATAAPSTTDRLGPDAPAPAGLSCTDIGGVFEAHYPDGRGTCVPADQRPKCHKKLSADDPEFDNYVPDFTLTPPFPQGTVDGAMVRAMLEGANNADCWKMPAQ